MVYAGIFIGAHISNNEFALSQQLRSIVFASPALYSYTYIHTYMYIYIYIYICDLSSLSKYFLEQSLYVYVCNFMHAYTHLMQPEPAF